MRILVRCPNWVGDCVMATPALRALRETFPDAHISLLLKDYVRPVLEGAPWFDDTIACRDKPLFSLFRTAEDIRSLGFDIAVIMPNSFRSALSIWLARVPRRVGYGRNGRSFLLTDPLEPPREGGRIVPVNMVDYYLALLRRIGCNPSSRREELFFSPRSEERAVRLLEGHGWRPGDRLIALNPGGRYGSSKLWEAEKFAAVGDRLRERYDARIIVLYGPGEEPIATRIAECMSTKPILPLEQGYDLDILKPIIKRTMLLVTNDTGTRHYAVAFDRPVVVIFGSTDRRYTDVNLEKTAIVSATVDCAPCQRKVCREKQHRCMELVTPEMVLEAAEALLARCSAEAERKR